MQEIRRYPLTFAIILANMLVYGISILYSGEISDINLRALVDLGALYGPLVVFKGEWWRLFTAMFLHGGMTHIFMNMFSLYLIGRGMEIYFSKSAYVAIYLFSGLFGGVASLYMHPQSVGIGASGAIFGVFGALAGFFLAHRKMLASAQAQAIFKDFAIIIGLNLVLGLSVASIDMSAHVAGLIVGLAGGFAIAKSPKFVWGFSVMSLLLLFIAIEWYLPEHYVQIFS
jgi:rhomboid protease GluP